MNSKLEVLRESQQAAPARGAMNKEVMLGMVGLTHGDPKRDASGQVDTV